MVNQKVHVIGGAKHRSNRRWLVEVDITSFGRKAKEVCELTLDWFRRIVGHLT